MPSTSSSDSQKIELERLQAQNAALHAQVEQVA
jgi:hypothetical protein